eukprot:IDg19461t1
MSTRTFMHAHTQESATLRVCRALCKGLGTHKMYVLCNEGGKGGIGGMSGSAAFRMH